MDFTARMMRRTLLCAVLACAASAVNIIFGLGAQAVAALCMVWIGRARPAAWPKARRGFSARGGRVIYCAVMGMALHAMLYQAATLLHPAALPLYIARALSALSGMLLQCALIYRVRRTGRRHIAACLALLALLSACMR